MGSFSESRRFEVVGTGSRVRYIGFLDIAYPYRVDLGAGVSSAGVTFVVYVPVIKFAASVVA